MIFLIFSLYNEIFVWIKVSFNFFRCDINCSHASSWASISIACKSNATLKELSCLHFWHICLEICIHEAHNENRTWSRNSIVTFILKTSLVNRIDLISFIWIPTWTNHTCGQWISISKDDFSHDICSRFHRWEIAELSGLYIYIISNIPRNHTCVWWGSWSLAVNSLMNWFQFIWTFISNEHILLIKKVWLMKIWLRYLHLKIYHLQQALFLRCI